MTMTQKILARAAGLPSVKAGQLIKAKLDMVLGNDITSPVAINEFEKNGFSEVFDRCRISLVMDHFTPNKDIKAAGLTKQCRTFAHKYTSRIILTWAIWVLSTLCSPKRVLLLPVRFVSVLTATPAPTVLSAHSPQV